MLIKLNINKTIISLIKYLFCLFVILDLYSVYSLLNANIIKIIAILLGIVLLCYYCYMAIINKINIKSKLILFLILYFIYIIFFYLSNSTQQPFEYIVCLGVFFPIIVFIIYIDNMLINKKSIINYISDLILIISIVSLFLYLFGSLLHIISYSNVYDLDWNPYVQQYYGYFNLYFENQTIELFGVRVLRNIGIFSEGPMFAYCLIISFTIELMKNNVSRFRVIILIITGLTTFSTTCYILLLIISFLKIVYLKSNIKIYHVIILVVCLILIFIYSYFFIEDKLSTISGMTRFDDIQASIKALNDTNIFTGYGFQNGIGKLSMYKSAWRIEGNTISSGIFYILIDGGYLLLTFYILPMIYGLILLIKKRLNCIMFFSYFFLLFTTCVPYRFLTLFVLAFLWIEFICRNKN